MVGAPFEVATKASFRISHPKSDDDAIQYLTPQLAAASTLKPRRRYIIYTIYIQDGSRRHRRLYARRPPGSFIIQRRCRRHWRSKDFAARSSHIYIYEYGLLQGTRRRPHATAIQQRFFSTAISSPPRCHIITILIYITLRLTRAYRKPIFCQFVVYDSDL